MSFKKITTIISIAMLLPFGMVHDVSASGPLSGWVQRITIPLHSVNTKGRGLLIAGVCGNGRWALSSLSAFCRTLSN